MLVQESPGGATWVTGLHESAAPCRIRTRAAKLGA